ncbi:MAG: DeoR/GlpR transcriptional regulator [Erysipelotrichaceae bacterium]|nr:DeoR/GlpR transcriptional regulator [Erysipelotrichaceae bacterium]
MLSKERSIRIMELLHQQSSVTIKDLMQMLQTSRSSVMRDLDELEKQGLIIRERGGASLKDLGKTLTSYHEIATVDKEFIHADEKRCICQKAAQSIQDGDCIYIDSGTTAAFLLEFIQNKQVTIVTPNTYFVQKLPNDFTGDIFLLGGQFKKAYDTSFGPLTMEMIARFHFDKAFLTANGLNTKNGEVYVFDISIGAMKKAVMERCSDCSLLMDASKFNQHALCCWAHADDFVHVYIDQWTLSTDLPDNFTVCQ